MVDGTHIIVNSKVNQEATLEAVDLLHAAHNFAFEKFDMASFLMLISLSSSQKAGIAWAIGD